MILCSLTLLGTSICVCYGVRVARFLQPCSFPGTMGFCDAPFLLVWAKLCHLKSQQFADSQVLTLVMVLFTMELLILSVVVPTSVAGQPLLAFSSHGIFSWLKMMYIAKQKNRSSKKKPDRFLVLAKLEANGKDSHYILSFFQLMDVFGHSVW